MKRVVAIILTIVLVLSTVVGCLFALTGCGNKAEILPTTETVTVTPKVEEELSKENGEEKTESIEEKEEIVEETVSKTDYTVEDIINALNKESGMEINYEEDGIGITIGLQDNDDIDLMYLMLDKTFDDGTINEYGYYVVDNELYTFVKDDKEFYMQHHLTNLNDKDAVKDSDMVDMADKFTADESEIRTVELIGQKEIEGNKYDIVRVFTQTDENTLLPEKDQDLDYYFNTKTGNVDYIETNDKHGELILVSIKAIGNFEEPTWFKDAQEIDGNNSDTVFADMMTVMMIPLMTDTPVTKDMF